MAADIKNEAPNEYDILFTIKLKIIKAQHQ